MRKSVLSLLVTVYLSTSLSPAARAQSTEERFHDLFVTAGYCTAFGAALGTAFLAFKEDPSKNLRFVAIGASLGFIGGSVLGSYVVFSPLVTEQGDAPQSTLLADAPLPTDRLVLRPTWNKDERRITAVEGGMTLLTF